MKKIFFLLIILVAIPLFSFSQDYWEHVCTNDTTTIWSMQIAKDGTIYYGSDNGLFISHDDGETWDFEFLGMGNFMYDIAFDIDSNLICIADYKVYKYKVTEDEWEFLFQPEGSQYSFHALYTSGPEIFVGNNSNGLYHFNGETWEKLEGQPVVGIEDIVKDTLGRLFTCGTGYSTNNGSVAQSLDNGQTWTLIGLKNSYLSSLAVDSYNRLYAGSMGNHVNGFSGLYRYKRESGTWDTLRFYHRVMSMLINEEDSLYIGQYTTGGPPAGAFMSPDYGETWYGINSGLPDGDSHKNVTKLALGPQNHLYCIIQDENSIYRSTNTTIVGINKQNNTEVPEIQIFPNPTTSTLFIKPNHPFSNKQNLKINIYSSLGKLVHNQEAKFSGESLQINVSSLPPGIYLLELSGKDFRETGRFVKK